MLLKNLTRVTAAAGAKQCAISTAIQSNRYMTVNRRLRYNQRFLQRVVTVLFAVCMMLYAADCTYGMFYSMYV